MTLEEMQKELDLEREKAKALTSLNERLEYESKKNKSRAQTAEDKITEAEKQKLQDDGKLEELLASERAEKKALSDKLSSTNKAVLTEKLRAEVAKHAKDAHNIDRLLGVTEHRGLLSINEDDLTVGGVEDFVTKVRETDSYLFRKKSLDDTEYKKPKGDDGKTDTDKYYEELDACNSSRELDACKKKWAK